MEKVAKKQKSDAIDPRKLIFGIFFTFVWIIAYFKTQTFGTFDHFGAVFAWLLILKFVLLEILK